MSISYKKLWKMMIDKNLRKTELTHLAGISTNAMAKLGRNEDVRVKTLEKLCTSLSCDLDQETFEAMNAFPKFVKLREAYIANVDEIAAKIDLLSTAIRISDRQFPEVYKHLPPICEKLDIPVPEIYYVRSKELNAWTGGSTVYLPYLPACG